MVRKEINLWEYLLNELRRWKLILLVAVICSVVVTTLNFLKSIRNYNVSIELSNEQDMDIDDRIQLIKKNMSDEAINKAEEFAKKSMNLEIQEEYLDNSLMMQINGNNVHKVDYIVSVDYRENGSDNDKIADMAGNIAALFQSDVFFQEIRDALYKDVDASYIQEIVDIKESVNAEIFAESASTFELILMVPEEVEKDICDDIVNDFVKNIDGRCSSYNIRIINSNESFVSDVSIIKKQRDVFYEIDSYKSKIESDKSTLAEDERHLAELLVEKNMADKNEDSSTKEKSQKEQLVKPEISKRNVVVGFLLGIMLVMGVDFMKLIITGRVYFMGEICYCLGIKPLLVFYDKERKGFLTDSQRIYDWQYKRYLDKDKQFNNYTRELECYLKDKNIEEIEMLICDDLDEKDTKYIDRIKNVSIESGVNFKKVETEFIGKIDTSSQLRGNSPIVIYIRQGKTNIIQLSEIKNMAEKNNRTILGFVYIDC